MKMAIGLPKYRRALNLNLDIGANRIGWIVVALVLVRQMLKEATASHPTATKSSEPLSFAGRLHLSAFGVRAKQ
jgi:hypothetical protein